LPKVLEGERRKLSHGQRRGKWEMLYRPPLRRKGMAGINEIEGAGRSGAQEVELDLVRHDK